MFKKLKNGLEVQTTGGLYAYFHEKSIIAIFISHETRNNRPYLINIVLIDGSSHRYTFKTKEEAVEEYAKIIKEIGSN